MRASILPVHRIRAAASLCSVLAVLACPSERDTEPASLPPSPPPPTPSPEPATPEAGDGSEPIRFGAPRPLDQWNGPLRRLAAAEALGRVVLRGDPKGYELIARQPEDASELSEVLGLARAPAAAEGPELTARVHHTTAQLSLRRGPSKDEALVREMPKGTLVLALLGPIEGRASRPAGKGSWVRVFASKTHGGWAAGRFLAPATRCLPFWEGFHEHTLTGPPTLDEDVLFVVLDDPLMGLARAHDLQRSYVHAFDVGLKCQLVSNRAQMTHYGFVEDLTQGASGRIVLHYRTTDDPSESLRTTKWKPEPEVFHSETRPRSSREAELLRWLLHSKAPLTGEALEGCAVGEHPTLGGLLRSVRREADTLEVRCLEPDSAGTRGCSAQIGNQRGGEALEFMVFVDFELRDGRPDPSTLRCMAAG